MVRHIVSIRSAVIAIFRALFSTALAAGFLLAFAEVVQ